MKMIDFHATSDFLLEDKPLYSDWVGRILESEGYTEGSIDFVFCDD